MSIQHYLKMIDNASVAQRCHAAAALAHTYLQTDLDFDERCSTEAVLTLLLDDPSPKVRLALAEAFSTSAHAPVHIVASLARDQIEVATYILGRSTSLSDADLIDCVAGGCGEAQRIIAARPRVSFAVSAAIIEIGESSCRVGAPVQHPGTDCGHQFSQVDRAPWSYWLKSVLFLLRTNACQRIADMLWQSALQTLCVRWTWSQP